MAQRKKKKSSNWGGARPGAGRKPGPNPRPLHRARQTHDPRHPVLVTLRAELTSLRSELVFPTVRLAIGRATRQTPERFRILHFSVQANQLHLIVEAAERRSLTAGLHGLSIRVTRYVNDLLRRRGSLWTDRWEGRVLRSPEDLREALVFVLGNFRTHAARPLPPGIDPCSSGAWFTRFRGFDPAAGSPPPFVGSPPPPVPADEGIPVSPARTSLLTKGLAGIPLIGLDEAPKPKSTPKLKPRSGPKPKP